MFIDKIFLQNCSMQGFKLQLYYNNKNTKYEKAVNYINVYSVYY